MFVTARATTRCGEKDVDRAGSPRKHYALRRPQAQAYGLLVHSPVAGLRTR